MQSEIFIVKGGNATGKSTRVFMLLKFLKDELKLSTFDFHISENGKKRNAGFYIPDLKLVIIGKVSKSGDIERFQGHDGVSKVWGGAAGLSENLKGLFSKGLNVIIEGTSLTMTPRLRANFLVKELNAKFVFSQTYVYEKNEKGAEDYVQRCFDRTGKKRELMTGSGWGKAVSFHSDFKTTERETEEVGEEKAMCLLDYFDAPPYDFGAKFLMKAQESLDFITDDTIDEFIVYCQNSNYILENRFENFK